MKFIKTKTANISSTSSEDTKNAISMNMTASTAEKIVKKIFTQFSDISCIEVSYDEISKLSYYAGNAWFNNQQQKLWLLWNNIKLNAGKINIYPASHLGITTGLINYLKIRIPSDYAPIQDMSHVIGTLIGNEIKQAEAALIAKKLIRIDISDPEFLKTIKSLRDRDDLAPYKIIKDALNLILDREYNQCYPVPEDIKIQIMITLNMLEG